MSNFKTIGQAKIHLKKIMPIEAKATTSANFSQSSFESGHLPGSGSDSNTVDVAINDETFENDNDGTLNIMGTEFEIDDN
jgi:hypothetical protein